MLSLPSTTGQNPGAGRFGLNVWRCPFILLIIVSNGHFALDFALLPVPCTSQEVIVSKTLVHNAG